MTFRTLLERAKPFLRDQRHWIPVALAYLAAWWLPITWIWAILHPGAARPEGIDGPVSWMWKDYWGKSESPNSFQLFLPIGVGLLIWNRRAEFAAQSARLRVREREGRPLPNRKSPWVVSLACVGLAVSHLIHLPALAIGSLIGIGVGILCLVYGSAYLTPLRTPLLYWILMVPPPASLITQISNMVSAGTIRIAAITLHAIGKPAVAAPPQLLLGQSAAEIGGVATLSSGGAAILALTAALTLTFSLYRREPPGRTLMRVMAGTVLGLMLNVARVDLAVMVRSVGNTELSDRVLTFNVWPLVLPAALLACYGDRLFRKRKPTAP